MIDRLVKKLPTARLGTHGFTIIEVLIVLAIAGLILLVVFLAVPALQRNSRNTSYRNEASQILTAYSEHSNNTAGGAALSASDTAASCGSAGAYTCDAGKVVDLTKNKNITALKIEAQAATPTAPTLSKATLQTGAKCSGNTASVAGAARQVALFFLIENSGSNTSTQCIGT
jgi:prepilin-type N-terminal cleavage/methylation domain-containing protein